jgi:CheY-like chemotaxis protein
MSKKILIVDDDPDFLFILNHVLMKEGYEVISAQSGTECLEKVEKEKPDMVFLDIMMPDVDGWEVCKRIKAVSPNLPVSMCSVLRDPEYIEKSIRFAGADEHLTKPLSFNKVLDTVSSFQSGFSIHGETMGTEG